MARIKRRKNQGLIICPKTKQYTDIIVCAAACREKCRIYKDAVSLELLLEYVEQHPEYKVIGELMATTKKPQAQGNKYWIISEENTVVEVSEKEIMENPQEYIDKQIWQRPPYKFELVISLKKVKAD